MAAFLDQILKHIDYFPRYVIALATLVGRPKRFLTGLGGDDERELTASFVFFAATAIIEIALALPFSPPEIVAPLSLVTYTLLSVLGVALFAAAVHLSWRCVGGSGTFLRSWILCNYVSCVTGLILELFLVLATAIEVVGNNKLYRQSIESVKTGTPVPLTLAELRSLWLYFAVIVIGLLATTAWFTASWGAFRIVYRSSRARSAGALVITAVLGIPIIAIAFFVSYAIEAFLLRGGVT